MKHNKKYTKLKCKTCGKEYCYYGWALRHALKTDHNNFRRIKQ